VNLKLIKEVEKDYSGKQKNFIFLKFLSKISKSKVLVSKKSGTVFHDDIIENEDNLKSWNKIFSNKINPAKKKYTSDNPIMNARHYYGVKLLEDFLKTKKKHANKKIDICDFGTGEGGFPFLLKSRLNNVNILLTEYSQSNIVLIKKKFRKNNLTIKKIFNGSIEDFNNKKNFKTIDIGTLNWTLCNTSNPIKVLKSIHNSLKTNGYLMIAESSRVLVPFKKPINNYFNFKFRSFYHPWHFSYNSLSNLLEICNFRIIFSNRYYDENDLFIIAKKMDSSTHKPFIKIDKSKEVVDFFKRWKKESLFYKKF
jgi:ubiquinone/menaquinone biosynthesis C-methylase UbiE